MSSKRRSPAIVVDESSSVDDHERSCVSKTTPSTHGLSKFQQIKFSVAKSPWYRGQNDRYIRKRYEEQLRVEKRDLHIRVKKALGVEGTKRLKILQSLAKDGVVEKYSNLETNVEKRYVRDAETGERVEIKEGKPISESALGYHIDRVQSMSALETLMKDISVKLKNVGESLERKKFDDDGNQYSPAARLFAKRTTCENSRTALFYLRESGWDPSAATAKYFKGGGIVPDEYVCDDDDDDDGGGNEEYINKRISTKGMCVDSLDRTFTELLRTHSTKKNEENGGAVGSLPTKTHGKESKKVRMERHLATVQLRPRTFEEILDDLSLEQKLKATTTNIAKTTRMIRSSSSPTQSAAQVPLHMTLADHYMGRGEAFKALTTMRRNHNLQLSILIEAEESKERERASVLSRTKRRKDIERLRKKFDRERERSRALIENVRSDNEVALAAKMAALGVIR